jgi:hypothetical protein
MPPILIYCADGNKRFAEIAIRRGFEYGACMPNTIYFDPYFTDQDWRKFSRAKSEEDRTRLRRDYMAAVENHRPALATVLDWEREEQFGEVMSWAEQAAQWVQDAVIIIPKVPGYVWRIPHVIGGKAVRLGYSAASTFSGTPVSVKEFAEWNDPVHCLGGGPQAQMHFAKHLPIVSADGNYIQNLARRYCQFYSPNKSTRNRCWPRLREVGLNIKHDAPYIAFELTCIAVPMAWRGATGQEIWAAQLEHLKSVGLEPSHLQMNLFEVVK